MENLSALSYELRKNVVDMIVEGKGGHIGGDMSVMEILVALYFSHLSCFGYHSRRFEPDTCPKSQRTLPLVGRAVGLVQEFQPLQ